MAIFPSCWYFASSPVIDFADLSRSHCSTTLKILAGAQCSLGEHLILSLGMVCKNLKLNLSFSTPGICLCFLTTSCTSGTEQQWLSTILKYRKPNNPIPDLQEWRELGGCRCDWYINNRIHNQEGTLKSAANNC